MDHAAMALMIPILALLVPIVAIWSKHRKDIARMEIEATSKRQASGHDDAQAERIAALEDRVRVLERIVTDPGHQVASQIEALRDSGAGTTAMQSGNEKQENVQ